MLRLRPYKPCDAAKIVSWLADRDVFFRWGGQYCGEYPLTEESLNDKYIAKNGGCEEPDNFYPVVAFDEDGPVGPFIMRYLHGDNTMLRFGWVVVDDAKRGRGYGREMLSLGLLYAFEVLGVQSVTLGVYENNPKAYRCYTSVGFRASTSTHDKEVEIDGEKWKVIELEMTRDEYEAKKQAR